MHCLHICIGLIANPASFLSYAYLIIMSQIPLKNQGTCTGKVMHLTPLTKFS